MQFKKLYLLNIENNFSGDSVNFDPVTFKFATFEDIQKLSGAEYDYEEDDILFSHNRLQAGDKVVIGYIDSQPVFYGWQMSGEFEVSDLKYHTLNPKIIYSYKVFVIASERNKSILRKYYHFITSYYSQQGIKSILVAIDNKNIPSIFAHKKCGFDEAGKIVTVNFLKFTYNFHKFNF